MNAVKRCLALFAATLVVGACSGDPTADDAGTNLTIRATPGAVWVRNNATATVTIEAVDKLGSPIEGTWAITGSSGPLTAELDTTYQNSYDPNDTIPTVPLGVKARFVVTPTAEGEGSVTIEGTGGSVTIPIRMAPDTNAFAAVFSKGNPALGDTITITAPAGTRFTAGTTVNFYSSSLSNSLQQGATPMITLIDGPLVGGVPDSTVLHVIVPAAAEGQARISGISNPSTPSLTVTARTTTTIPVVDTKTLTGTYSVGPTGVAPNTPVTVTLTQPGYKFRTGAGAAADTTAFTLTFPGSAMAGLVTRIIDSNTITFFPPPGYRSRVVTTKLFNPLQPFYNLSIPFLDTLKVDSLPKAGLGQDDPLAGPVGIITLPAMAVNDVYVFWDNGTLNSPDYEGLGQGPDLNQYVQINITTAGRYRFSVAWDGSATAPDVDNYLLNQARTGFRATCGTCGANPEVLTTSATTPLAAGSVQYWAATLWDGTRPTRMRVVVTRIS